MISGGKGRSTQEPEGPDILEITFKKSNLQKKDQ